MRPFSEWYPAAAADTKGEADNDGDALIKAANEEARAEFLADIFNPAWESGSRPGSTWGES